MGVGSAEDLVAKKPGLDHIIFRFNKMTASEFESDWKQRNTDQKLDFIHMIQMLYYVTDPEATVSIFRSLLNKDGKLLIILVSGQSGWGRLWRTYQAQLCTSDISQCVMTGDVRNFLSIKGIPYQSHTLPSQMDITECFTAGDEKGELLLDFLTRSSVRTLLRSWSSCRRNFKGTLSSDTPQTPQVQPRGGRQDYIQQQHGGLSAHLVELKHQLILRR
ncbi:hypothetical protein QTP86_027944, partial [Hemibagrus guttatus]